MSTCIESGNARLMYTLTQILKLLRCSEHMTYEIGFKIWFHVLECFVTGNKFMHEVSRIIFYCASWLKYVVMTPQKNYHLLISAPVVYELINSW